MSSGSNGQSAFRPTTTPFQRGTKIVTTTEDPLDFRVGVEYPARIGLGRLQTVVVKAAPLYRVDRIVDTGVPLAADPLPVRLIVPGALLTPAEQELVPSPRGLAEIHFHITPMVTGKLLQARVEVLRGGQLETFELPVHVHGRALPWVMTALTILIPLLLYLPTCFPNWIVRGSVEREVSAWLPQLPVSDAIARQAQNTATFLATAGQEGHVSFFAMLGLLALTLYLVFIRRPHRSMRWGQAFLLGSKTNTPPTYLTPVSAPDIGSVR